MTYLRKFGAVVLLMVSFLTPTMACAVADSPMTVEERACCQTMKSQCGQKGMPASHGCCQRMPANIYDNALATKATAVPPVAITAIWLTASEFLNPTPAVSVWTGHLDYGPPKPPPSAISILRI